MTCIVGLVDGGTVWMGGDRAAVDSSHYLIRVTSPKIFRLGSMLIGYTSSFRMGQLLRYRLVLPERGAAPLDEFLATSFTDAVRACLKDGGYTKIENSRETAGVFLFGIEGRLFTFDDDYNTHESMAGYDAVGGGISVARGSLHSTAQLKLLPETRVRLALEAAAEHVTGVSAPFDVLVAQ